MTFPSYSTMRACVRRLQELKVAGEETAKRHCVAFEAYRALNPLYAHQAVGSAGEAAAPASGTHLFPSMNLMSAIKSSCIYSSTTLSCSVKLTTSASDNGGKTSFEGRRAD